MTRLTKKVENRYIIECPNLLKYIDGKNRLNEVLSTQDKGIQKLGQLEDIEEELGIDLVTLFKAFSKGSMGSVYKFVQNDYSEEYKKGFIKPLIINYFFRKPNTNEYQLCIYDSLTGKSYIVDTKDYGKTWALDKNELTKEELENE